MYTGVDRHFQHKTLKNLYFHAGAHIGFAYGLNQIKYDEEASMGKSIGEAFNLKGAFTGGSSFLYVREWQLSVGKTEIL